MQIHSLTHSLTHSENKNSPIVILGAVIGIDCVCPEKPIVLVNFPDDVLGALLTSCDLPCFSCNSST